MYFSAFIFPPYLSLTLLKESCPIDDMETQAAVQGSPVKAPRRVSFDSTGSAGMLKRNNLDATDSESREKKRAKGSSDDHAQIALHGLEASIEKVEAEMREAMALRKSADEALDMAIRRRELLVASRKSLLESLNL